MPSSAMEGMGHSPVPDGMEAHDVCLATKLCRRCGASAKAIARGERANWCEPGVTGISWIRAVERMRGIMEPALYSKGYPASRPDDPGPSAA